MVFEFDKQDRRHRTPTRPAAAYAPFDGAARRSLLVWGEHCTECAAPDCYASCALYQPRPDRRCRRFEYGMYRNRHFPSAGGAAAEVVFRRWGKIEAEANVRLLPTAAVAAAERAAALAMPALGLAGRAAARLSGDERWSWLAFALLARLGRALERGRRRTPDAFVVELYNPGTEPVALLLSMAVDRTRLAANARPDQLPRPLLRRLVVQPGYFREELPGAAFDALVQSGLPFSVALSPAEEDGVHLVFLSLDFVDYREAAGGKAGVPARPAAKCVVFDLDHTLWDGVLLEGPVALRAGIAETFRRLDERGILISVVSKNAPEDAMAQLRLFGLADYVLYPEVGWGPKSDGVRRVAERLDIGIDSLIFVDDNPFERAEVAAALPAVETLPDTAIGGLLAHPRLQGAVTAESRSRRAMYKQAGARAEAAAHYGEDYKAFLRDCRIRIEIRPPTATDRQRVAELVQRTNQLNFSGRKYRMEEVDAILADPEREKYVVRCSDRYGDYGIVGFCLASAEDGGVTVHDLMLSCRVQGKFIEQALFSHLARRRGWSARHIAVNFIPTARNGAARGVLEALGFAPDGSGRLRREVDADAFAADLVEVDGRWDSALSPAA
jgi:FkbH-like protein